MWNTIRSSRTIIFPRDSELSVALPLVCDEELQAKFLPDHRTGWRSWNSDVPRREVLRAEALRQTLFSLLEKLRGEWVTPPGDSAPDRHHADRYFTYNTVDYFDFLWPMLALPGVSGPGDFFRVLKAVLDAERSESAAGFFAVYFDLLRDFEPRALEWDNQRRFKEYGTYSVGVKAVMPLVELKFEPHQFEVLEAALDFIREDVEHWPEHDKRIREHQGQTIWVAFDLLSFTMWAQAHPCMTVLRGLSRFCRDGEDEMTRLLRVPEDKDKTIAVPVWPNDIIEDFAMSVENRSVRII
ncbi:heterokaryon incompatibility protein het-6-like protein [Colletotrichum plurivorum]|uniref:Heterokaryon incompatibility protein het-6-like protein n=1 Tax=Colletotrichum plurivorum TaxID=2175906 RepID=A0A8H6N112_9PEZI|nr:heterokaryon incompatibility protein het-6-like protein [Colletotrichum plurivorum]